MQGVVSLGKKDDIDWLPHFRKALEDYVSDKYRAHLKNRNNYGSEKGGHDNGTHRGKYIGPGSE